MTKQELKLELAKVAIEHGLPLFDTTLFYNWIVEEDGTVPDNQDTYSLDTTIAWLMRSNKYGVRVTNICTANNIYTVGDLLEFGIPNIKKCRSMGKCSYAALIECLKQIGIVY